MTTLNNPLDERLGSNPDRQQSNARRLPPLKSIEAFVEVARSLNFTRAGQALNITTSAVSRRIQILENDLGVRLLSRSTNGVGLTAAGERYFESVSSAFFTLRRASTDVVQSRERGHLRIIGPESFLSIWLMPRLPRFHAANPEIDFQLDSIGYFESFARNEVDVAFKVARTPTQALSSA